MFASAGSRGSQGEIQTSSEKFIVYSRSDYTLKASLTELGKT